VVAGLMLALNAHADFTGRVVSVADGDTITVLRDRTQVKVRLLEIDAPEKAQAFGTKSKESLAEMCFGKTAELTDKGKDRYGRTLARVNCEGVDANAEQVRRGMAWVYDRYVTDMTLYAVQEEAKANRRGIWHDDKSVPPWEWRKDKR
jgi:endonuclease YncB( thermonuclease family)